MAEPIKYESVLPSLAPLLLGTKNTGTSSNTTTGTTFNTANLDPLSQVFNTAMGQAGMGTDGYKALIDSIFQEGAQSVPSIIGAYANATGSRASDNSAVRLALNELNRQMSTQALQAILQNQQQATNTASNAAGNIAANTRQTTQNSSTQGQQGTKQTIANPKAGYGAMLGGFLLNQADKRGLLNGIKLGGGSPDVAGTPSPAAYPDPVAYPDAYGVPPAAVDPFAGQAQLPFSYGSAGLDSSNLFDLGGFDQNFGNVGFNLGSSLPDLGTMLPDFGAVDLAGSAAGYDPGFGTDFGTDFGINLGGAGGGFGDFGAVDAGSAVGYDPGFGDFGPDFSSGFDSGGFNFSNELPLFDDGFGASDIFDFGSFFADGGIVQPDRYLVDARGRRNQYSDPRSFRYIPEFSRQLGFSEGYRNGGVVRMNPRMQPRGYADGGTVSSNPMADPAYRAQLEQQQALQPVYPEQYLLGLGRLGTMLAGTRNAVPPVQIGSDLLRRMPQQAADNSGMIKAAENAFMRMMGVQIPGLVQTTADQVQDVRARRAAANGFADGGLVDDDRPAPVIRNRNNMGNRRSSVKTAAINLSELADPTAQILVRANGGGSGGGAGNGVSSQAINTITNRAREAGGRGGAAMPRPELLSPRDRARLERGGELPQIENAGSSGIGEGIATGAVSENPAAAAQSFASAVIGMALGVPSVVVSQALSAISGISSENAGIANGSIAAPGVAGMSTVGSVAPDGAVAGMSTPTGPDAMSVTPVADAFAAMSATPVSPAADAFAPTSSTPAADAFAPTSSTPAADAFAAMSATPVADAFAAMSATPASPDSISTTGGIDSGGTSTGGTDGTGDAAAAGVGGGGFSSGGLVSGPGTSTSDSIRVAAKDPGGKSIRYSDSEFVIPAEVVRMTGSAPWQALVDAFNKPTR